MRERAREFLALGTALYGLCLERADEDGEQTRIGYRFEEDETSHFRDAHFLDLHLCHGLLADPF